MDVSSRALQSSQSAVFPDSWEKFGVWFIPFLYAGIRYMLDGKEVKVGFISWKSAWRTACGYFILFVCVFGFQFFRESYLINVELKKENKELRSDLATYQNEEEPKFDPSKITFSIGEQKLSLYKPVNIQSDPGRERIFNVFNRSGDTLENAKAIFGINGVKFRGDKSELEFKYRPMNTQTRPVGREFHIISCTQGKLKGYIYLSSNHEEIFREFYIICNNP